MVEVEWIGPLWVNGLMLADPEEAALDKGATLPWEAAGFDVDLARALVADLVARPVLELVAADGLLCALEGAAAGLCTGKFVGLLEEVADGTGAAWGTEEAQLLQAPSTAAKGSASNA
ncbi:hypothetical protein ACT3UQ_01005 [Glutamicibacter sp. AOP12-B1-11]|uniref:hypothetical protein n=1 Tax=Micrococcaceae TaxID=1268 RepID=UPI0015E2BB57|nr:hypothetical protein [Arthrobacter sp. MYb224]